MSAGDTLRRLLTLLPLASRAEGVELEEAARATGVDVNQVMADLDVLTARSYYLPAGSTDDMQIHVDGTRIRVSGPNPFTRPLRLTRGELLALSVALRVAGVASEEAQRICAEIEGELAARGTVGPDVADEMAHLSASRLSVEMSRIEADFAPPASAPPAAAPDLDGLVRDHDGVRDTFSTGVLARRTVTFAYLKPTASKHEVRTLEPYRLLHAEGEWYVVGRDPDKDGLRLFRLDRVLGAMLRDERFEMNAEFDVDEIVRDGQVALLAEGAEPGEVPVRYTPRVAPWVAERWDGREDGDGGYVVRHRVYEERWLMRTVMRYGGEASVADG
jgi:predicted DNA-binding transcriptional regulator YafY